MLSAWASIALIVFVIIFALFMVVALGIMAFALVKLRQQIDSFIGKVDPVVAQASDAIETVQRVTMNIGERADHILSRGEVLTDNVSTQVERTATVVEKTVTRPLINLNSIIAGVSTGFTVYGKRIHNTSSGGAASYETPRPTKNGRVDKGTQQDDRESMEDLSNG